MFFIVRRKLEILKLLAKREAHISELSRTLGISVPAALKHVRGLEELGLVERRAIGKSHLLRLKPERLRELGLTHLLPDEVEVERGANLLEVLQRVWKLEAEEVDGKAYISAVDGERGYYVYEVDGELPSVPINEFRLWSDCEVEVKRLVPVPGKRLKVRVGLTDSGLKPSKGCSGDPSPSHPAAHLP